MKVARNGFLAAVVGLSMTIGLTGVSASFAAGYVKPVAGTDILRLVEPAPSATNSVDLTANAEGTWDTYYGAGLRFFYMYRDIGSTFSLTYRATNAAGTPLRSTTVYLLVNKATSCSKTTFYTSASADYPGSDRSGNVHVIPRDWCGDQPQMGAGESSIAGTTNSSGEVTFTLQNTNLTGGEAFPAKQNAVNTYTSGKLCQDDSACLGTTITASMFKHPSNANERAEDKDILNIHFVNPSLSADQAKIYAQSGVDEPRVAFHVSKLSGEPVEGVSLVFTQEGEGNDLEVTSGVTNAQGVASIPVTADEGDVGLQVIKASVYGSSVYARSRIYWSSNVVKVAPSSSGRTSISGTAKKGSLLTLQGSSWSGSPSPSLAYSWLACTKSGSATSSIPANCTVISGARSTTYKISSDKVGKYIRGVVKAQNSSGGAYEISATTSKVK